MPFLGVDTAQRGKRLWEAAPCEPAIVSVRRNETAPSLRLPLPVSRVQPRRRQLPAATKELLWYDGGHSLPVAFVPDAVAWFQTHLQANGAD